MKNDFPGDAVTCAGEVYDGTGGENGAVDVVEGGAFGGREEVEVFVLVGLIPF